jgi:predicted esterase
MGPHEGLPVVEAGAPIGTGRAVVIMVHGRGAGPENILSLQPRLERPDLSYLAPAAAGRTWYPQSFLADIAANEPFLTSALDVLAGVVLRLEQAGVPRSRVVLLGFSQGACLSSEFVIRQAAPFGGLVAFSGGVVGPPGTTWSHPGRLDGMSAFLGCSDRDAHVPASRVLETADVLRGKGAHVTSRLYEGMGHVVNDDEIAEARRILDLVADPR